ncbi:outer membrane autotransporter barrel domain-containing protein [Bartonella vinsonii subsp. arupensis Pm136co]|uniref:Outer membrane autotransporter barrel domain-containing protein n=1 Tax=Bartonella vinsonii subsp. arupensis Pm136co TaxID=1094561 RepID=A0ABP2QSM5_BARVI|nr:autotransporter outer membrane beta-barrel domain-containing protein [Bartonella vinsonii]EJF97948.1 outer membrane autotransporter barrel domain-containing protein [Bartonella vinsonii subsp. arupensis Pm136co]
MMIKILKRHVCLCALTTSVFFFVHNIDVKAQNVTSCNAYRTSEGHGRVDPSYADFLGTGSIETRVVKSEKIVLGAGKEANSRSGETLKFKKSQITTEVVADPKVVTVLDKISVTGNGKKGNGLHSGIAHAVFGVKQGGSLIVKDSNITVTNAYGLVGESAPAVFSSDKSLSDPQNTSQFFIENSSITIRGHKARGLYFQGGLSDHEYIEGELLSRLGDFQFKKTTFKVLDGTAVYVDDSRRFPYVKATDGSRIFANLLLDAKNNSVVGIEANNSFLVGGTRVDKNTYAELVLYNKSQWTVSPEKKHKDSQNTDSSISFIRLDDSSIVFKKPQDGNYQTLHVWGLDGYKSLENFYVAKGNARLFVNAHLDLGAPSKGIKADKLLIYGDVEGKTKVYVVDASADSKKSKGHTQDEQKDIQSVSIVQVYGKAEADSFKLANNYVALRGAPYRYRLRAYGPGSSLGKARNENRLVTQRSGNGNGDFWDFRLEAEYVKRSSRRSSSQLTKKVFIRRVPRSVGSRADYNSIIANPEASVLHSDGDVRAVVPQVPTYLLLPNALFQTGLMDVNSQNEQMGTLRTAVGGLLEKSENPAFFVRGYGGSQRYVADLSALEYGFGGNFHYNAVEAGFLLTTLESAHRTTTFGIMGTYGKMSLQPRDIVESKKSAFDKWLVTAYGSMRHDTGFYLDGLLSYGLFQGDVLTLARGKTTTLKGNPLSASLIGGKAFVTGYKGLIFDPQVQVVYQHLHFDKASDIDGFDIEMGKPDQWVVRVGGRLTKTLSASEKGRVFSFNGKLHLVHSFGEKQFVHLGDAFQLSAFGSSLDAGLGFNAQLSPKFSVHGNVTYQHKLSKAGFSGTSFSGGIRYRF